MGTPLFPAGYDPDITAAAAMERFGALDGEALEQNPEPHVLAGRIMSRRDFGKASFVHIKDRTGRIQAYIRKDKVGDEAFSAFKLLDIGDIIGLRGRFFPDEDKRADPSGGRCQAADQVPEAPSGEVARADGQGDAVPAAVRRPDRE